MGTDIHMVLQKKDEDTNEWKTLLKGIPMGRDRALFEVLSGLGSWTGEEGIATEGFPEGFTTDAENMHGNHWMGEYGFGHVSLRDFVDHPLTERSIADNYRVEKTDNYLTIEFIDNEEDEYYNVRAMQQTFRFMFYQLENYRLVFGYDS